MPMWSNFIGGDLNDGYRRGAMRLLVDTTPLRVSRDFRRLWIGQAVSVFGTTVTTAALPFQVFEQTGSSLAVGLLGAAELGPLLVCAVVGGSFADRVDKRRLLLGVTALSLLCSATLAVNASLDHPQLWLMFVVGAVASGVTAISFATMRSLLPLLLEQDLRPAGFALQSIYTTLGWMAGPAVAARLGGGPVLYGLLLSSVAAGGFVASLGSGWTTRVHRQGSALLIAVAVWGVCIAAAGLTREPAIVLTLFVCAGGADMVSAVFRSTIAANLTPDDMRGRVSGVEFAVYAGGPVLGDVESGVVGGLAGVPFAIVSGGVACVIAAGIFAARVRGLARYRTTRRRDADISTAAPS